MQGCWNLIKMKNISLKGGFFLGKKMLELQKDEAFTFDPFNLI